MLAQICLIVIICAGAFADLAQNEEWTKMSKEMATEKYQVRISTEQQGDICLGALVSSKKVLTTKKCIQTILTDDLRIRLGKSRQQNQCRVASIIAFQQQQQLRQQQQKPHGQRKEDTLVIITLDKEITNSEMETINIEDNNDIRQNENTEVQGLGLNDNIENNDVSDDEKTEQENLSVRKVNLNVSQLQGRKFQLTKDLKDIVENGALAVCTSSQKLCGIKGDDGKFINLTDPKIQEFLTRNL